MSVDVTKLASGLTVITDTMPHLETAALGVWAGVGGRDEKPNEHGISHLLEHMAFKGTTRRSSREIVEEIEAVGGDLNAGTSTETTAYYARVMKADVPLALDVLSDILANPSFVPDELEREKSVIVQEIGAAQDTPDDVVFEHLNELCYPDQPMGRSLLGTAKTLKGFDRDTLRGYLSTHYRGPDMVVAAAGAVDHKQVVEEVAQRFASFDGAPAPKPQAAMFGKGGSRVVHRELEQAHLTLALEGVPQTDLSLFSLQVFTNTLGGGMSSRLFQEVREKRGLCYSIYTFHAPYSDTGFFGLYTGTDPGDAPEMMEVIVDVINDAVETLTEAEIARAKAQMKAGLLMALESCSSRAEQLARHVLAYGRPLTVEELVARIDAVSVESTRNAARAPAVAQPPGGRGARQRQGSGHGGGFCGRIDPVEGQDAAALGARCDAGAGSRGVSAHGPVSVAIQRTGRARPARPWPVAARAADVRFPAMGASARISRDYLTPWEPIWPSDDLTRSGFRRRLRRYAEDIAADRSYPFIVFRESDGAMIGGMTLANVRRGIVQAGTIGYWVGQPHAHRGYMTAALRVLLPSLFGELNLHRIEAACIPSNAPSIRVLEKCGFSREGLARRYLCINGVWQDHLLFGLLHEDFRG